MAEWVKPYADMILYCAAGGEKPLPSLMAEAALQLLGRIDLYGAIPFSKRNPRISGPAPRRPLNTRKDLTGSDEWRPHCGWPVGSGCISMIPARSIVQTQAAHKRRGKCGSGTAVGLQRAKRSGCGHCLPCAKRCGSGHCRQGFKKRYRCNGRTNAPQNPGIRKDLPDSNLWSGKSGCIVMISIRANVQTRSAPKR